MLLRVLKGLMHWAHAIYDRKEDLLEELDLLKNVFISNKYAEQLVAKTFQVHMSRPRETLQDVEMVKLF